MLKNMKSMISNGDLLFQSKHIVGRFNI